MNTSSHLHEIFSGILPGRSFLQPRTTPLSFTRPVGDIPDLSKFPAAHRIDVNENSKITGLF
jgi:hypothetical protein